VVSTAGAQHVVETRQDRAHGAFVTPRVIATHLSERRAGSRQFGGIASGDTALLSRSTMTTLSGTAGRYRSSTSSARLCVDDRRDDAAAPASARQVTR
jgi:hypothetical protein